jgi:hypothetical protein
VLSSSAARTVGCPYACGAFGGARGVDDAVSGASGNAPGSRKRGMYHGRGRRPVRRVRRSAPWVVRAGEVRDVKTQTGRRVSKRARIA